jgi:DNA-binding LacI/PurR family transcriptional regulator/signal transduction histidine kinase
MGDSRPRIGLIGPGLAHYIFRHVIAGAAEQVRQEGASLIVFGAGRFLRGRLLRTDAHSEAVTAARLSEVDSVDAVVVYASGLMPSLSTKELESFVSRLHGNVVMIGAEFGGYPAVTVDNQEGMRRITEHMITRHRSRSIAYIGGPPHHPESAVRLAGVRAAIADAGLELPDEHIVFGDFTPIPAQDAVATLLDNRDADFDTIICANDATAAGAIKELRRRSIRVPEKIAVTGFDDSWWSAMTSPAITTARQDFRGQGREAIRAAVAYSSGGAVDSVTLEAKPLYRASCGCEAWLTNQQYDEGLVKMPQFQELVDAVKSAVRKESISSLRSDLSRILAGIPERGDDLLSLAMQEAIREIWGDKPDLDHERVWAQAAVVAAEYDAAAQRRHRLEEDDLTVQGVALGRQLDQVIDADQFQSEVRSYFDLIGIGGYEFVRFLSDEEGVVMADPERSSLHGQTIQLEKMNSLFCALADTATEDEVTVVVPLPFMADILGFGAMNIDSERAHAGESIASSIGALINRFRILEELDRVESLRRKSYQKQVATQKQLIESERLASLGRLVAGIAHEMNTPLGVTTTALSHLYAQTTKIAGALRPEVPEAQGWISDAREAISIIERGVHRLNELVARFQSIAPTRVSGDRADIDAGETVRAVLESMTPELEPLGVATDLRVPIPIRLKLPIDVISRILYGLIANSVAHGFAGPGDNRITIAVVPDGTGARIDYSDNGVGVDSHTLPQLFDPFFTTGRQDGHVGLGLHAIHNMVTSTVGGTIVAECPAGSGLVVRIGIPDRLVEFTETR